MRDEIQAYLDGLNIRANVLDRANERIAIFTNLRQDEPSGTYLYDNEDEGSTSGIRQMDGDRVLIYLDCNTYDGSSTGVEDTTLAEHFRGLTHGVIEDNLYSAQELEVTRLGGVVTNSGWAVMCEEDFIEISSKTDIGKITSRYTYATKETEHEWY